MTLIRLVGTQAGLHLCSENRVTCDHAYTLSESTNLTVP